MERGGKKWVRVSRVDITTKRTWSKIEGLEVNNRAMTLILEDIENRSVSKFKCHNNLSGGTIDPFTTWVPSNQSYFK